MPRKSAEIVDRSPDAERSLDLRVQAISDKTFLNTAWLLHAVFERLTTGLLETLHGGDFPDVRRTHLNLLQHLGDHGARMGDLASQANLTKAAMTILVRECQGLGFVEVASDPNDGRVRNVRFTKRGSRLKRLLRETLLGAEDRMEVLLGAHEYSAFRATLLMLFQVPEMNLVEPKAKVGRRRETAASLAA